MPSGKSLKSPRKTQESFAVEVVASVLHTALDIKNCVSCSARARGSGDKAEQMPVARF